MHSLCHGDQPSPRGHEQPGPTNNSNRKRPKHEQEKLKSFSESITDLNELPRIMEKAVGIMDISDGHSAFAEDTLSIEIQGPDRPHLTLVDIPGIIQSSTRGVSNADVAKVAGITEHYIKQHRTICLAVVSATNDAANQPILQQVRKFDPRGEVSDPPPRKEIQHIF